MPIVKYCQTVKIELKDNYRQMDLAKQNKFLKKGKAT
jgi:hypothetical protein